MPPRGVFGIPHEILSSTDEEIAFVVGLVALLAAVFYSDELDIRRVAGAATVGVLVALVGSFAAPPEVSNEWHIPVLMVLLVIAGVIGTPMGAIGENGYSRPYPSPAVESFCILYHHSVFHIL